MPAARKLGWSVLRIVLAMGACAALFAGGVILVLAYLLIADGKFTAFLGALAGGIASLLFAWLLARCAGIARRRANDLAIAEHAEAIRLGPPHGIAHIDLAFVASRKRNHAGAIAHFEAAIRQNPADANAHVGRVNAYGAMGEYPRMIADYTESVQRDPNNALAYAARATAHNALGQFYHSIPDATEAIRLDPNLHLGYDARGYGLLQRGGYTQLVKLMALAWMLLTFGFLRRDHPAWTPVGSKADYAQAIADFTEAIRLHPAAWDCYHGRALVYRALGDHTRAAEDMARMRQPAIRQHDAGAT
jgi:tetratricopeptide (TPR) repeat protein